MTIQKTFMELNCSLIQTIEKIIHYQHHVTLLCTNVKFNKIPQGLDCVFTRTLLIVIMITFQKTVSVNLYIAQYLIINKDLNNLKSRIKVYRKKIISVYPEKSCCVKSLLSAKHDKLHPELAKGRHRKFLAWKVLMGWKVLMFKSFVIKLKENL